MYSIFVMNLLNKIYLNLITATITINYFDQLIFNTSDNIIIYLHKDNMLQLIQHV